MKTTAADGVSLGYKLHGSGSPTLALLPGWMIANQGIWTPLLGQLPSGLRAVRYDSRGTGASDRPVTAESYHVTHLVGDAIAVLDATDTGQAIVVGNSLGGLVGAILAAQRPERVAGLVLIGATIDITGNPPSPLQQAMATFDHVLDGADEGWRRYNRHSWRRDYPGFVDWFVATALGPNAPVWALEDGRRQGLDVGPEILAATIAARAGADPALLRGIVAGIRCPVLVLTGEDDAICPPQWSFALAAALGTEPIVVPGAGHCPHVTHPDLVAKHIVSFATEVAP